MKFQTISKLSRLLCGAAMTTAIATATAVSAQDMRIAHGLPETYPSYQPLVAFAETIGAETGIEAEVFDLSLLSLAETPAGVRDGVVDMGLVAFPYFPAEYSEVNLVANLSMLSTTGDLVDVPGAAMLGASMEYTMLGCPDCLAELSAQNQVFIGGMSTGPYALLCTQPVESIEDVSGLRFRSAAANFARWAEAFGGTSVSISANETYNAMGQGTVDCTMSSLADLLGARFIDVAKTVTVGVPGGVFSGIGVANINQDRWRELSEDQRAAILKAASKLAAVTVLSSHTNDTRSLEAAKEQGIQVTEASDSMRAATERFLRDDIEVIKTQFTDSYGVENTDAKVAQFEELLAKWKDLAQAAGTDADALSEVYWFEVFSKVDPSTYGMN